MFMKWYYDSSKEERASFFSFLMNVINTALVAITLAVTILVAGKYWSANAIVVAIILFILFIFTSFIYLFFMQMSRTAMTYRIIPYVSIIDTDQFSNRVLKDLEVTFKKEQRKNLYLILIEFQNVGNTRIERNDFKSKGITVGFGAGAQILDTNMKVNDRVLEVVMKDNDPNIVIDPFVSKPNEAMTLRVFLGTKPNIDNITITVDGFPLRHVEHPNEKSKKNLQKVRKVSYGTTLFLFIASFAVLLIILLTKLNVWVLVTSVTFLSLLYLGFITIKVSNAVFMNLTKQPKI